MSSAGGRLLRVLSAVLCLLLPVAGSIETHSVGVQKADWLMRCACSLGNQQWYPKGRSYSGKHFTCGES